MPEEVLVVGSKVKAYIKAKGCHTSGELVEALSKKVSVLLDAACQRTKDNKRTTVKVCDL